MSLVFALTVLVFTHTCSETHQTCQSQTCSPGYYKNKSCGPNDKYHLCEECADGTYTEINNTSPRCLLCGICSRGMEVKKSCSRVSNVVCDCKEGYYRPHGSQPCKSCDKESCKNYNCQSLPECKQILTTTTTRTAKASIFTTTLGQTQTKNTTSPNPSRPPSSGLKFHLWVILVILLLPVLYCLPVFFARTLYKYLHLCPRWRIKQDMEVPDQDFKDPGCHQSGAPTTLAFTFSEETPMMNVMSPAPSERHAHVRLLLPHGDATVARDPDPTELWPAIVLYTIIKEVPLRRWKEFMRLLSVGDQEMERVELDAGLSSMERQYQMLRLWSQRSSASIDDIFSALQYMELSGCAQMLKESLEKLQWRVTA